MLMYYKFLKPYKLVCCILIRIPNSLHPVTIMEAGIAFRTLPQLLNFFLELLIIDVTLIIDVKERGWG